ncbi:MULTISPECIES: glucose 1-dehydrogenase [Bordetella]|uniref:2-hydroxycyclohexanecarboxyl-CoA dehydrogenase n=1 Tax=Bordetella genomosp. 6 TaxID=463024 RepID=A0ABX4FDR1_9BORD|nr:MULTISPECIES: glucose 1-dehydrogenase [Bordetella]AOB28837.1 2-hydroxycyclohexanecarboxyl-CoA dehydrogenase [Bordetella bronchiseptica]ARP74823.1 2-hydroxycyclohexanecarboxyl-CoA dehydrogenase [Bordetella genomosp. 6]AZW46189.1 3-oxoacyl-ACP reductase [Bordetella bronchiseptica]KCV59477.1 putative 2-hydroxycyclohexanecarboxyl-CoA dehydrogenase [Bordetella bronchiseptica 99-R-0433]MBN3267086.1 3-oxoacyl-ACP reductase [Bordetella bronchiseptica]
MKGLKEKVVIVTGGCGGIGAALCERFAQEGAKVAILDLNAEGAGQVAGRIQAEGGVAASYGVDITDYPAVAAAVARVESELGPVDVLVNNAGWDHAARFLDTEPPLWDKIVNINLKGPINLHHAVLKGMVARGKGSIVNVSSDAGRVGSSGESVYSACKGGIIAFTKTIAREVARKHINVNVVCPGPTDTPLFRDFAGEGESGAKLRNALEKAIPFGRLGQPQDVVGAVCFLASEDADFITGQVLSVSGGLTMAG